MNRLARLAGVILLGLAVTLTIPALAGSAAAAPSQDLPPLVPTDGLLPLVGALQPVLEVVSPVVWPQCANAVLVSVLPGALGVAVPPELSLVTGPLLVLCGSVPIPGTNQRTCALDAQAQNLLAEATKPLLGTGLPVEVAPAKWVSGLLDNIVDQVPDTGVPAGSTVAATFQCQDRPPPTTTPTTVVAVADPATPTTTPTPEVSFVDPPTFGELQTLPPLADVTVPEVAAPPAAAPEGPVLAYVDLPRFRYPIVMGLPLAFLALVAFFGRALTRPLDGDTGAALTLPNGDPR